MPCLSPWSSVGRGSTTSRTSPSSCRATSSSCSPASPGRASRPWRSTRSTPRASAATSSRSRRTPGSSSGRWTSPTSTSSRVCPRRSPSTRSRRLATRAPPSARSRRSTTTSGCSTPASACPTAPSAAPRSPGRRRSRSSTGSWSCPRARASRCWRRWCAAARAPTRRFSPTSPAQGYARARIDGEVHELTDKVDLARYEQHTIEVVVDRLVVREGLERRLTDSLETALRLADGVAEVQLVRRDGEARRRRRGRRGRRHPHLLPAPGVPQRPRVLRGAGPTQLLLQLALRRLRHVRRPRHPLRGRPRADRAEPRRLAGRRRHLPVGQCQQPVLQAARRVGGRGARCRHGHAVGQAHQEAATGVPAGHRRGQGAGSLQEPLRAGAVLHRELRGRRALPAAAPLGVRERQRPRADRGLHAGGALPCVRRRPAGAAAAVGHDRRPLHRRDL